MWITRKAEFSASHVCAGPGSPAVSPHGHGHNFVIEVTLEGRPDPATGMLMDLKELRDIIQREIVEPFDHRMLNREVPPFDRVVPTPENIAVEAWRRLEPHLRRDHTRLWRVRLWETEDFCVDYWGEAAP